MRQHTSLPPRKKIMRMTESVLPACATWRYDQDAGLANKLGNLPRAPTIESAPHKAPETTAAEQPAQIPMAATTVASAHNNNNKNGCSRGTPL